jgi:hypothetical protein
MRNRSFFWPFVLIATGLVWLLIELRTIPVNNLWALAYMWPFLLMAAGIGLILRSRWPAIRMIVSGLIVLGMILSIVFAPQMGWNKMPAWSYFQLGDHGNFNGSVRGSGSVKSETRKLADFNSIEINYPVELTIRQGSAPSLTVEAEDNLLPQLSTRVSGNTLFIENSQPDWTRRVYSTRPIKLQMTVKDLKKVDFPSAGILFVEDMQMDSLEVSISGAGSINLDNLTASALTVDLSGAGSITASGAANSLDLDISGLGSFKGGELTSQTGDVSISGAGSATVWTKNNLDVEISGTGSVKYYGSPSVQKEITGLGSVISLGNK